MDNLDDKESLLPQKCREKQYLVHNIWEKKVTSLQLPNLMNKFLYYRTPILNFIMKFLLWRILMLVSITLLLNFIIN
jgi:hypothetical protein